MWFRDRVGVVGVQGEASVRRWALPVVDGQSLGRSQRRPCAGLFSLWFGTVYDGKRVLMDVRVRGWDTESMATAPLCVDT